MNKGQYTAVVLLLVLLGLEILRSPNVQAFFKGILTTPLSISNSTSQTTTHASTSTTSSAPTYGIGGSTPGHGKVA